MNTVELQTKTVDSDVNNGILSLEVIKDELNQLLKKLPKSNFVLSINPMVDSHQIKQYKKRMLFARTTI